MREAREHARERDARVWEARRSPAGACAQTASAPIKPEVIVVVKVGRANNAVPTAADDRVSRLFRRGALQQVERLKALDRVPHAPRASAPRRARVVGAEAEAETAHVLVSDAAREATSRAFY